VLSCVVLSCVGRFPVLFVMYVVSYYVFECLVVVQSMAKINPAQIAMLKEMQPEFNFQERKVQPSLNAGGDNLLEDNAGEDDTEASLGGFSDKSMGDLLGLHGKQCTLAWWDNVDEEWKQCMNVCSFLYMS
jgi:hypothetical protein